MNFFPEIWTCSWSGGYSSTSVGCNVGKEVRYADSGKKGDVIFEIDESMCGKTIKLSEYIN
jgi:hypothetical protein